jgi:hypothetical protein
MNRIRINVALVPDVVLLQLRFLRRIGFRQPRIEGAVVDEDGRFNLWHLFWLGRAAVERCGCRSFLPTLKRREWANYFGHAGYASI